MVTAKSPKGIDMLPVKGVVHINLRTGRTATVYSVAVGDLIESFKATIEGHGFEFLSRERDGGGGPHEEDCVWIVSTEGSLQDCIESLNSRKPRGR